MPKWNNKCPQGGPMPFDANAAIAQADFNNAVYVETADSPNQPWQRTRYAVTYVDVIDDNGDTWTVTVISHIHRYDLPLPGRWVPGNTYIPGWGPFDVQTTAANVAVIAALQDGGAFPPGNDRYPRKH